MPINILMPALSPTMEKGNLAKWLKKEGDAVKSGDVIAEIETDKATMEVEAVDDGTLAKIVVPEGTQDVAVNDIIAVLAGEGEDVKAAGAGAGAAKPAAAASPSPQPAPQPAPAPQAAPAAAAPPPKAAPAVNGSGGARIFSSPLARRLAKDAGIDIGRINGSGPHGRIIARDVEGAKSGKGLKAPPAAAAPAPAAGPSEQQVRAMYAEGSYEVVPHDNMRKIIAQRLSQSKQTIPHFYLTIDCDIGKLVAAREEINAAAPKDKDGKPAYKLSVNDFVIKALALALQRVPDANVTWTDGAMLKHKASDVGVAVAIPGGLITPVIRNAHSKPVSVISAEMKDYRGTRAGATAEARGVHGRHDRSVQPRHVRHQGILRRHQPAACDHPRRRRRRAAPGGAGRQGRDRHHHERDALLRSSRRRRRARGRVPGGVQAADRKSRDDGGVAMPLSRFDIHARN